MRFSRRRQRGFSYIEVLLAVLLLGLCAAPAANALRSAIGTADVSATELAEVLCLTSHMETTIAIPYRSLALTAGGGSTTPVAALSLPEDSSCGARSVFVRYYNPDSVTTYPSAETGLVEVRVTVQQNGAVSRALVTVVGR